MTEPDELFSREWLETNGTGAFISGSVAGAPTRHYHNLFMVPRKPPVDRVILVNHCETYIRTADHAFPLSSILYPGTIHPDGHRWISSFKPHPWPTWTFEFRQEEVTVSKEIFMIHQRNIVLMKWTLNQASTPVTLSVRPQLTGREYRGLHLDNDDVLMDTNVEGKRLTWNPYDLIPKTHAYHSGTFHPDEHWFYRVQYPEHLNHESTREEDFWSPGQISYRLEPGDTARLLFSTDPTLDIDPEAFENFEERERERRESLAYPLVERHNRSNSLDLLRAAGDFSVKRDELKTIFAGYPWFTDWGRDTFISLTGLLLVPGYYGHARDILLEFSSYISRGMVPNRFPESGDEPEYNTIDASLWYIHALGKYLSYSGDEDFVTDTGWKAVCEILQGYRSGTRYDIRMDEDGLIQGGTPDTQLTWMDAQVGDTTFTPRDGKPVEIQALWIRSLAVAGRIANLREDPARKKEFLSLRNRAITSFRKRFWYEDGEYLYDVVDGHAGNDTTFRPNQIYAAMFEDVLPDEQRQAVVTRVQDRLLTPYGLRTLAPSDPAYQGQYYGSRFERDRAYHQGTVWPFLLGGFVSAWMRLHESTNENRERAASFFDGLKRHLTEDAAIGQVSEIFDGDPPHEPKGCIAQAWSVAEPIRALYEDVYPEEQTE